MRVARFDDFDACVEAMVDWDIEAVQLDRGSFEGELIQAQSATTLVSEATFGRKLHQTGEPPKGLRTVGVPADPEQQIGWRNHRVSADQLMFFPRGCGLDAVSLPNFHVYAVAIPEERISELAHALGDTDYQDLLAGREVLECDPDWMLDFRRALKHFVSSSADLDANSELPEAGSHDLGLDLMELLIEVLTRDTHLRPLSPYRARDLAIRRSLDLIDEHERESLSVADLCRVARASRRTLEYAFRERFELSPKAYMLARRLSGVRAELSQPDDGLTVTRAANTWGFHHLSQFAALYKRQFGDYPSETLRATWPSR